MRSQTCVHICRIAFAGTALLALLGAPAAAAQDGAYPLYTTPPSPEALADALFPARYRNAGDARPASHSAESGLFGMLVRFDFDSSEMRPDSTAMLDSVGEMLSLQRVGSRAVVIEGHADATGAARYNQSLSVRRAEAVRRYLVGRFGIDPDRLVAVGKGENLPYAGAAPADPRNRRVVFRPLAKLVLK